MWSSIDNLKEDLKKIVLDVHDDDSDEEEDLTISGTTNAGRVLMDSDWRNSNGFRYSSRSVSRSPLASGVEPPVNYEVERYKAEINKLQESEATIKARSVNYAALLKEKEEQISRLNQENGSLKQNLTSTNAALKEAKTDLSRAANNNAIKGNSDHSPNKSQKSPTTWKSRNHIYKQNGTENNSESHRKDKEFADMLEEKTRSMASAQVRELEKEQEKSANLHNLLQEERKKNESLKEEVQVMRLDKEKMFMEIRKVRSELDAKLDEIKHLQTKLNGRGQQVVGISVENLKEVNKALEKENDELKLKRSELEAALEASRRSTSSKLYPEGTEALCRHPSSLDKEKPESFPGKEDMEKSLQRLQKDLEEASREKDKARQELKRLKQHLLEKETEESEKMDEDSRLIEELRQANEYQRTQILSLDKALKQAMANQEEFKSRNNQEIRNLKGIVEDLNQKLANCLRTIDSKNVELLNLQTALGQYYAEIEAKEHFERELAVAKEEAMRLSARLKDVDERLESSKKEKEEIISKQLHTEQIAAEWKNRVNKVEEDNAKVRRVLEQSMTRLNRMSMDSDFLVDRRIVIKLLVTYFQKSHSKEVLDLMVRMLGFSEEDKQRIGLAQQGASGKGVRGVLGFPGRLVGGIIGGGGVGPSPGLHPNMASDNHSFADMWVDFLLKDAEERERREAEDAANKEKEKAAATTTTNPQRPSYEQSDSEFSTVPLTSSDSNQRLSRLLT